LEIKVFTSSVFASPLHQALNEMPQPQTDIQFSHTDTKLHTIYQGFYLHYVQPHAIRT